MSNPEQDVLNTGRGVLRKLHAMTGNDPEKLGKELEAMVEAKQAPAIAAGLYAAILDGQQSKGHGPTPGAATAALGAAAGLSGHSSDLYRAARVGRDVRAVERSAETGDPSYVVRRAKNVAVGRMLGRAGVWRRLWK